MNLLKEAETLLAETLKDYASENIAYTRLASGETFIVPASLGKTIFRTEDYTGITTRVHGIDFLVSAADLPFQPERGDVISFDNAEYEVLAPDNEAVWRWSSGQKIIRRIHTKEVEQK